MVSSSLFVNIIFVLFVNINIIIHVYTYIPVCCPVRRWWVTVDFWGVWLRVRVWLRVWSPSSDFLISFHWAGISLCELNQNPPVHICQNKGGLLISCFLKLLYSCIPNLQNSISMNISKTYTVLVFLIPQKVSIKN